MSAPDTLSNPDTSTPSDRSTVRLRVDLAYDGAPFHGFAENHDVRTVAGTLRVALQAVLGEPVELTCAGRTDSGVHARGQVVSLDVPAAAIEALARRDRRTGDGLRRLRDGVNALVGPSVALNAVSVVEDAFDARFSATDRTYRYTVLNAEVPDPFLVDRAWWVDVPLDLARMSEACGHLIGTHDFSCFCRRPKPVKQTADDAPPVPASLVRQILTADWSAAPDRPELLTFTISATAFCHQMVRSITGMLVDVGRGRRASNDVAAAIASQDRAKAGQLAPPHGLVLWHVGY
ncbi:MAG TPA: tRNA pseudouridine(38-40) synthase TruA [Microthrixaceae bacterium]|nr:tRNA pseudouridine(38-40) synthase TruA [Microthrixaceae bacterium]